MCAYDIPFDNNRICFDVYDNYGTLKSVPAKDFEKIYRFFYMSVIALIWIYKIIHEGASSKMVWVQMVIKSLYNNTKVHLLDFRCLFYIVNGWYQADTDCKIRKGIAKNECLQSQQEIKDIFNKDVLKSSFEIQWGFDGGIGKPILIEF